MMGRTLLALTLLFSAAGFARSFDLTVPQDEAYILLSHWEDVLLQGENYNKRHRVFTQDYAILEFSPAVQRSSSLAAEMIGMLTSKPLSGHLVGQRLFVSSKNFAGARQELEKIETKYLLQRQKGFCHFDSRGDLVNPVGDLVLFSGWSWETSGVCAFEGPVLFGACRMASDREHSSHSSSAVRESTSLYCHGNFLGSYTQRARAYRDLLRFSP